MPEIAIIKRNHQGEDLLTYTAHRIDGGANWICIQAAFAYNDVQIDWLTLAQGDLMTEWFYADRYYNVFMIEDGTTGTLKGWYCNVTRPAEISAEAVAADDLALDVLVSPAGEMGLLDEDDFAALDLSSKEQQAALDAVEAIRNAVTHRKGPFARIQPS